MKHRYFAFFAVLASLAYAEAPVNSIRQPESMLRTLSSAAEPTENLRTYVAHNIKRGFTPQKAMDVATKQSVDMNVGFSKQKLIVGSAKKK